MSLNIPAIAEKLNDLAPPHPIGKLQDIRTQLKNLKRRPGDKIFSTQTIFDDWAFHHGGRTERAEVASGSGPMRWDCKDGGEMRQEASRPRRGPQGPTDEVYQDGVTVSKPIPRKPKTDVRMR
jgi:hypothetical protein